MTKKRTSGRTAGISMQRSAEDTALNILGAVSAAMELRDEYTHLHQGKVANLAAMLADYMGHDADFIYGLRVGALLHDVGKIALPSDILNKPGKLNAAEISLIRMHPEYGGRIFQGVDLPWPVADMVMQHHERLDGSGYPRGLKDGDILPQSRFIAVADTLDAMATARPYRRAPGLQAALGVLKVNKGRHYDADIVSAAEDLFESGTSDDAFESLFGEGEGIPSALPRVPLPPRS